MTPTQAKAALARALARHGYAATISRGPTSAPMSAAVRLHMIGYQPHEIVAGSGLQEGDSKVIVSAEQLAAAGWPSDGSSPCPRKGDWITVGGRKRIVLVGWPAPPIDGEIIRYEAQVR